MKQIWKKKRFGFKCLSPRRSVQRIMAFIFLPNKVLCHTLKHISEVSLGAVHSNNSLIFFLSLRQLVLLVFLSVFLLTYFSLLPETWHTEAGTKCVVALTALLTAGKVRRGCPNVLGQDG